nr:PilZ domain-containing protein [uncultured Desulfobulbus sp.]
MTTALQSQNPGGKERRQHRRCKIHPDALVFIGKEPGSIIDMSEGGLAVHFVSMRQSSPLPKQLDLFFEATSLYFPDLPVMVVNEISAPPHSIFSSLSAKRLCLQFGPLSNEQHTHVRHFLQTCSIN